LRGGGKLKVVGSEEDAQTGASETSAFSEPAVSSEIDNARLHTSAPPAHDGNNVARRSAEERQGLKQLASELRELLALLEQENKGRTK
jgi:hypothetical protein